MVHERPVDLITSSSDLVDLGSGDWFGIPRTVYFLAVVALVVYYLLEHTPYGRYLQSIGSNADAARLVGLRVDVLVLLAFVISATLAGFAGVLLVARNGGASPQLGTVADTLQALAAAYLGATAIKPGRFNVLGTLVAIFFLAFTVTGLSLAGRAELDQRRVQRRRPVRGSAHLHHHRPQAGRGLLRSAEPCPEATWLNGWPRSICSRPAPIAS